MLTPKRGCRQREGDQIPTRSTTVIEIMSGPSFALGVADARAGRRYHRDYDLWNTNTQWIYERGRMWAALAPRDVPLKHNGRLSPAAVRLYNAAII